MKTSFKSIFLQQTLDKIIFNFTILFFSFAGFQLKSAYTLPPDWKADIPYTLDSVARYSYQNPSQPEKLKLPISRYGSNKKKSMAVNGTSKYALSKYAILKSNVNSAIKS